MKKFLFGLILSGLILIYFMSGVLHVHTPIHVYQSVVSSPIISSINNYNFQYTNISDNGDQTFREKIFSSPYVNRRQKYNQSYVAKSLNGYHKILWWNEPSWMIESKWNSHCNVSLCEYSNCKLTVDKRDANTSSAIIVSIVDGGYPVRVSALRRFRDQGFVFFSLESPMSFWNQAFKEPKWHNVFNWSMTYRRDADIFIPYGLLKQRESPPDKNFKKIFRSKTKQVAWIVSHCHTDGKREEYIKQLQNYIQVDIYGKCAGADITYKALEELLPQYKFYLGFENVFSKDYITEKFFYYFKYDSIVTVRGLTDYDKLLPNNTFINTANFPSIESLGQYLVNLSNDETEYIRFLKEINKYDVSWRRETYCNGLCELCEKVNNIDDNRRAYGNIFDWTGGCERPKDLF